MVLVEIQALAEQQLQRLTLRLHLQLHLMKVQLELLRLAEELLL